MTNQTNAGLDVVAYCEIDSDGNVAWDADACFSNDPDWLDNPYALVRQSDADAIIASKDAEIADLKAYNSVLAGAIVGYQDEQKRLDAEIERLTEAVRYRAKSHEVNCGLIADKNAQLAQQAERIAAIESRMQSLAQSVMTDQVSNDSHALFIAAIRDLAAISDALGCDPDDGGAVPIIEAIDELKDRITTQSAALAKANQGLILAYSSLRSVEHGHGIGKGVFEVLMKTIEEVASLKGTDNEQPS